MTKIKNVTNQLSHYLYPLNPSAGYGVKRGGQILPNTRKNFFKQLDYRKLEEWGVAKSAFKLHINDLIWVHFAQPDSAICAVGRVATTARWNEEWGKYSFKIRWDKDLTERLKDSPIPSSSYGQIPYAGVTAANEHTAKVLNRWLSGKVTKEQKHHDEKVRFRTAQVEQRIGQPQFRAKLMRAYNNKCAVTGCAVDDVLQAAHIRPVRKSGSHTCTNGLLLRADIHNLFDRGLLTIDKNYVIELDESLHKVAEYKSLHGRQLKVIPSKAADRPSKDLLQEHRIFFESH
jgi:hypothetical protein